MNTYKKHKEYKTQTKSMKSEFRIAEIRYVLVFKSKIYWKILFYCIYLQKESLFNRFPFIQYLIFMIVITDKISLSQINFRDKPALLNHLNNPLITQNVLSMPSPYTEADADKWIEIVEEQRRKLGSLCNWAIRNEDNELIGGIGLDLYTGKFSHRAEMGYWLAEAYWGKGIMTEVVKKIVQIAFTDFQRVRVEAAVFDWNIASSKVLEKAGFAYEGRIRNAYLKNKEYIDGLLYSILKK